MNDDKRREPPKEPRKPGRPEQRTTLAPLEFEEALRDLIATGKPDDETEETDKPAR